MSGIPDPDHAERADAGIDAQADRYTGAYLVLLADDAVDEAMTALQAVAGVRSAARVSTENPTAALGALTDGDAVVFDQLGVAVVSAAPDRHQALLQAVQASPAVLAVEAERVVSAFGERTPVSGGPNPTVDESQATWGLQVTRVPQSPYTGEGVRVAVLDTGMAPVHRDFTDRVVKKESFVPGQTVDDGHGHGTHCIGTACGPTAPTSLPRYGIAGAAEIYAGKVLSNEGYGTDAYILAGMNWAVLEGCRVISMSLGAPTTVEDAYSQVYEQVARRAMRRGTLVVAAAGNASRRPGKVEPVGHPANCPSIVAVAALAPDLSVASFSCAGLNPDGGLVDIAAPGVGVLSAAPEPLAYQRLSGTSMATPYVAGILALLSEANPGANAATLRHLLVSSVEPLVLASTDVGAGLVLAPV
jgi:subtilisin family serine protease